MILPEQTPKLGSSSVLSNSGTTGELISSQTYPLTIRLEEETRLLLTTLHADGMSPRKQSLIPLIRICSLLRISGDEVVFLRLRKVLIRARAFFRGIFLYFVSFFERYTR